MSNQDKVVMQQLKSADIVNGGNISEQFDGLHSPKLPDSSKLELGEIALNIAKGYEVIAIKNNEGEVVFIPFNVAVRLLDTEKGLDELSGYTVSSVDALSAATVHIYEDFQEFKEEVTELLEELISGTTVELKELIEALSAETQDSVARLDDRIDSLSATTNAKIADVVIYTNDKVDGLSAETASLVEGVKQDISNLDEKIDSVSADTDSKLGEVWEAIDEISGTTGPATIEYVNEKFAEAEEDIKAVDERVDGLSGYVDTVVEQWSGDTKELREDFDELSAFTEWKIDSISGAVSGCTEIEERLDEIELVHAGAFAAFKRATGLGPSGSELPGNVYYNPTLQSLSGCSNMTEAIDQVGEYAEAVGSETERLESSVIDNEMVHSGAFGRLNHSLGFTVNGEYVPTSEVLENLSVTEAIDLLTQEIENIEDFIDQYIESTKGLMISVTYEDLRTLRNNGKLKVGHLYRITNYQATVNAVQSPGFTTRVPVVESGNMGFDIIVRAIAPDKLDENATAMMSEGNYYFEDNDLNSWQIKYCIDNDTQRFMWADNYDNNDNGLGVIYWMKDEYGNEAPYDFKNIVMMIDNKKTFTFHNTFNDLDLSRTGQAFENVIKAAYQEPYLNKALRKLNNVTFRGEVVRGNVCAANLHDTILNGEFIDNYISVNSSETTVTGPKTGEMIGYTVQ